MFQRTAISTCCHAAALLALFGCGINKSRLATEQLVVSEAVDKAVAGIDFAPLTGKRVFFDTQYLDGVNMGPTGNIKYVISSFRQQMTAYDVRLQEKIETADYVVEARVGVLANDGYELTYGIPGSAAAASATVMLASPVPVSPVGMPELSIGRRNHQAGTAKVGLFAYDRVTREPVWQAGIKRGTSDVRDTWFMGLGPYHYRPQRGRGFWQSKADGVEVAVDPLAAYSQPLVFERAVQPRPADATLPAASGGSQVMAASGEQAIAPAASAVATGAGPNGAVATGSASASPKPEQPPVRPPATLPPGGSYQLPATPMRALPPLPAPGGSFALPGGPRTTP
jgi:hypothetical protein